MFGHRLGLIALLVSLCASCGLRAQQPFDDLLRRIPAHANAILLIDAKQIQESPYGLKQKITEKRERDYLSGAIHIPPTTSRLLLAAQFNPGSLAAVWEVALAQLTKPVTLQGLLKAEGGNLDQIASQDVLLTARNSYLVPFGNKILGGMRPANRQVTARWIREAKSPAGSTLTPYLADAASAVSAKHPIVMAVDLADVFDKEGVLERLKHAKFLSGSDVDLNKLAGTLSGIKGFKFEASVTDTLAGEIRIEFSSSVSDYSKIAKPLVMSTLDAIGAHVSDLDEWKVDASGSTITMSGGLTHAGLRQLLSPLLRPSATVEEEESPGIQAITDPKAIPSQRYYRSVNKLLTELQDQKAKTLTRIAYFMTKYADSIDELPLLNVDSDLLKFGAAVSKILRIMSGVATGTESSSKLTQALTTEGWSTYGGYGYGYAGAYGAGYGYVPGGAYYSNNYGAVASSVAQGQQSELQTRVEGFKKINEAKTDIRQKMVERYHVEF